MPTPGHNRLLLFGSSFYRYLLGPFRFSTDVAAPLPSPYTEGGAAGSLAVVDTGSKASVSGGALTASNVASGTTYGDPGLYSSALARSAGRALLCSYRWDTAVGACLGWTRSQGSGSAWDAAVYSHNTDTNISGAGVDISTDLAPRVTGTFYQFLVGLRGTGAFYFIKGGVYTNWTLFWVLNAGTTASLYAFVGTRTAGFTTDDVRVLDLGTYDSRFATDEGLATDRKATSSAGDTITMRADAWVEHTLTAATGVDKDFYVRWTDDNNCWIVRQNQAGSTVKLVEKVAGVETSRLSVAQTFTNAIAYRLIAICDGSSITVWVNTTKAGTYASATTNQTATTAKAPAAGVELKSYPRFVTLPSGI